ncbi:MAG TPA: Calx-beta domain-containing protein, partial [Micromonosporaceae bacterium]|nr:Calx-beta domain-containing protein [Micromonosporaceae bacterium]
MKFVRIAVLVGAIALATFGIASPAQAAPPALRINDSTRYEFVTMCQATCGTFTQTMEFLVELYPAKNFEVTVNYQVQDITTTAGQDYTVAATGTITLAAGTSQAHFYVPIVNDGVAESNETFRLKATGISVNANISDTGTGTILDGGNMPADCSISRVDPATHSITCTNRPAGQQWVHRQQCMIEWLEFVNIDGNVVTGNGTSTASCGSYLYNAS